MKRYALILTSILVLLVLATSVVLASVALPPANPTAEPPGQFLSEEQVFRMEMTNAAAKRCQERLKRAMEDPPYPDYENALREYHECMKGVFYYAHPERLPTIELPNGNSPGQGN